MFRHLSYSVLVFATGATLAMIRVLSPTSLKADLLLSVWLMSPYALLLLIVMCFSRDRPAAQGSFTSIALVTVGGLTLLADIIWFHPDAQGPIALLMVPLFQLGGILVTLPLARLCFRRLAIRQLDDTNVQ